jgi:beta-phosphoglucomutase-like phosphatase (HAD superfamily)
MAAAGLPMPATAITSEVAHHGKPDPESYLLAAGELGVPAHECVVIEDAPAGLVAARAAGTTVIAVSHTFSADILDPEADYVISSFDQLRVTDHGLTIVTAEYRETSRVSSLEARRRQAGPSTWERRAGHRRQLRWPARAQGGLSS